MTEICIVDDNEAVCHSLAFLLDACCDMKLKIYHDPLIFLQDFSSDWRGFLLIDLFMPNMNGIDLVQAVKLTNTHIKNIIISGHGSTDIAKKSLDAGAHAFIAKPIKVELLLTLLNAPLSVD